MIDAAQLHRIMSGVFGYEDILIGKEDLDLAQAIWKEAQEEERERNANIAEAWSDYWHSVTSIGPRIARAIRSYQSTMQQK